MNKFAKALGITVLAASVLGACSSEESTMSSGDEQEEQQDGQEEAEAAEKEDEEEEKAEAVVEVKSETFGSWEDSIDNVYASYSAEVTNTGDQPASVGDIQVNFEGEDGSILGTASMLLAVPEVIMPGETAYIGESTIIESVSSADEIANANANIDFSSTEEEPMMLDTENVNFSEGKDEYSSPYQVTGTVINQNEEKADDIRLAAGLYDEGGEFLGTLNGSIEVSLNQDGKAGFELEYPELPEDVKGKVAEVKVKAYNWSF
ncbi:hypothetical protein GCM10010954_28210 [Halobacillus andaensis]|uniref:Lipoprotein n=1 Tax=Halobacillus andaensis TaxID=1176239 RepID=A0A917EWP4_HALAA|nr:FxLYD domain-containing protein [Halobacillus andaensis]MBP2006452.1 hypothetical protein [Halobacillus andaensis]GGF27489.1 hypothetical protein GCM10010954_28210 [Halobacillus andaensis]